MNVDHESGVLVSLPVKNWIHRKTAKNWKNCTQKITTTTSLLFIFKIQQYLWRYLSQQPQQPTDDADADDDLLLLLLQLGGYTSQNHTLFILSIMKKWESMTSPLSLSLISSLS